MGNYVFTQKLLLEELQRDASGDSAHDFGRDILPGLVGPRQLRRPAVVDRAIELLHDVHERISPTKAVEFAKRMEQFHLFFLEDALSPEQIAWFRNIRQVCSTPLAMGELFNSPHEWAPLIAERLIDFDLAANNGGWQWAAGTGSDAAPYFRIFNPVLQGEKFDPLGDYVRRWVPELARVPRAFIQRPWEMPEEEQRKAGCRIGRDYLAPIVDHGLARQRALAAYRSTAGVKDPDANGTRTSAEKHG